MRKIALALVGLVGLGLAAITGLLPGKGSPTLAVQQNVRNLLHQNKVETVVSSHHLAVYYLSGERKGHALCTKANGCFGIWKPVTVKSKSKLSKASGIKGKLGVWNRNGFHQVTLGGRPLYTYFSDSKGVAGGDTITSFGGTWHLIALNSGSGTTPSGGMTTPTTTTPTMTTTCLYPPC